MLMISGKSDCGRVREKNEDCCFYEKLSSDTVLAVVCDGMGGKNGGNIASSMAVEQVFRHVREGYHDGLEPLSVKALLLSAILTANQKIYEKARENPEFRGMGTTLELALIRNETAYLAHVGDSSMFSVLADSVQKLTVDHTVVQMMVEKGQLSEQEAKNHPQKHLITRAVGVEEMVNVDYFEHPMALQEGLLLCSDGVTNELSEDEIFRLMDGLYPKQAVQALIEAANERGGHDNMTAVLLIRS